MRVDYTDLFIKQHKKAPHKIQLAWEKRFELFLKDQFNPLLKNHQLTGGYKGDKSINVTGDWRAIFTQMEDEEGNTYILFKFLGTHSQLYK